MGKTIDLTGQVFGRLTVVSRIEKSGKAKWLCRCQCENIKEVFARKLIRKQTQSCGCLHKEIVGTLNATHGMSKSPEFRAWAGIKNRCHRPTYAHYECYGGRGITVCDRWLNSFENFYNDMGPRPSACHSIDRIDVNGNYEPGNCRWATIRQQHRNTRSNAFVQYLGKNVCIAEAAELSGIRPTTLHTRLRRGWSGQDLFLPVGCARTSTSSSLAG
jgi:hypothetical protein